MIIFVPCDWRKLATEETFFKLWVCKRSQCCYLCKQKMMDRKSAEFSAKGSDFFSSFLNGRRVMEMRASIALSAWNVPSLQTNKNITLPLGKFRFLKTAWIWALNQWMKWLCWVSVSGSDYVFRRWIPALSLSCKTSLEQLFQWLFVLTIWLIL